MKFRIELVHKNSGDKYYTAYEIGDNGKIVARSAGICETEEQAEEQCQAYWLSKTKKVTVVDHIEIN